MNKKFIWVTAVILLGVIAILIFVNKKSTLFSDESRIEIIEQVGFEAEDETKLIHDISQLEVKRSLAKSGKWYADDPEISILYLDSKDNSANIYHIHYDRDGKVWVYVSANDMMMYLVQNPEILTGE